MFVQTFDFGKLCGMEASLKLKFPQLYRTSNSKDATVCVKLWDGMIIIGLGNWAGEEGWFNRDWREVGVEEGEYKTCIYFSYMLCLHISKQYIHIYILRNTDIDNSFVSYFLDMLRSMVLNLWVSHMILSKPFWYPYSFADCSSNSTMVRLWIALMVTQIFSRSPFPVPTSTGTYPLRLPPSSILLFSFQLKLHVETLFISSLVWTQKNTF